MDTRNAPTRNAQTSSQDTSTALRVVLDTNVLLSLFVFADSRFLPLRTRIESGDWLALTNERCLGEFRRVLAYPLFSLDAMRQETALSRYAALAHRITATPNPARPLPLCSDADDQKFLELARDGGAELLVTSDKALLKMARRNRLCDLFRILTPDAALGVLPAHARSGFAAPGCEVR